MTEQAVVNVHGEISEQHGVENGEDQQKVKVSGDCNGLSHATTENGDAVAADGDSAKSDLVAIIDNNGDGGAEVKLLKVGDGESQVTVLKVAEAECETVDVNNKENDCSDASAVSNGTAEEEIREKKISNDTVSVDADIDVAGENADIGSVTILDISGDMDVADVIVVQVGVKGLNKIHDHEVVAGAEDVQNGVADRKLSEQAVENVIHGDVNGVTTTVTDSNDVVDVQSGVEDEIHGDTNGVTTFTDANGPIDVLNCVEDEIHGDANGVAITDANGEVGIRSSVENEVHDDSNEDTVTDADDEVGLHSLVKNENGDSNEDTITVANDEVGVHGEPFANTCNMKNNVVKRETEPSVQGEISVEGEGGNCGDGKSRPTQEGSTTADSFDGQNVGSEEVKRPFYYYLIRLPRYDDNDNIQEQIKDALKQVEEKTELRGKIRAEVNSRKDICNECLQDFRAAKSAEQTAWELLQSKRQEMDSVKSTMSRLNNAISVRDIDNKIKNMEYMIQHETLCLIEEMQLIRQIKQLKQNRGELSSIVGKQDQSQKSKSISNGGC